MAVKTPEEEKKLLENQTVQPRNTGYQSKWQDSINSYISQIQNRKPFEYNVNEDALYNQYANQYAQQGKMAMMDTMGQAAALTGGYGNSYAQSVGQQAYQGYLNQLNDVVPQLYSMALDRYMNEGNQMYDQLNMMQQQDSLDYGRYRDQMADQDEAYNKLVALMTNYHYEPTAEEMAAAGMPEAHKNAIMKPYYDMLAEQAAAASRNSGSYDYVGPEGPEGPENQEPTLSDAGKQFVGNLPYLHAGGSVETWKRTVDQRLEKAHANGQVSDEDVILITKQLGL